MTDRRVLDAVEDALGVPVAAAGHQGGGDVADASRVELTDGRTVFVKTHRQPPPGFFSTEAAGLSWLRDAAGAVDARVCVPAVLAVSDGDEASGRPAFLVLEWIEVGRAGPTTDADCGRGLAALHREGAPCFGRADRRTTGSRGLPNEPYDRWSDAYAANRLLPLARLARDGDVLPGSAIDRLERVAGALDRLGIDDEAPARLHGDLWAGNRLVGAGGRNWLIDPAAHGGHLEFDLAMMRLFGVFGADCFSAYAEVHPLAPGFEERVAVHQLAPLVVHAVKFGGSYVAASVAAIERSASLTGVGG